MRRRGFLGMLAAGFAVGWRPRGSSYVLVDDLGEWLRSITSCEVPIVDAPLPLLFSLLPKSTSFRLADGRVVG